MSEFGPLVSAEWLHEHLGEPDLRVIDFRWYLLGKNGRDEYLAGHIPGAVFVELDGSRPRTGPQEADASDNWHRLRFRGDRCSDDSCREHTDGSAPIHH